MTKKTSRKNDTILFIAAIFVVFVMFILVDYMVRSTLIGQ